MRTNCRQKSIQVVCITFFVGTVYNSYKFLLKLKLGYKIPKYNLEYTSTESPLVSESGANRFAYVACYMKIPVHYSYFALRISR